MAEWAFLANHARVLLHLAHDPGARLRHIAASLGITERSAYGIVADLTAAGYVVKQEDGRRNRYQIQAHLPLPGTTSQQPAVGEVPALLAGTSARLQLTRTGPQPEATAAGRACMHPGRRQAPGSPDRLIRPQVRDGPPPHAGKLLARKRPRLVPVTDKIIVAGPGRAGRADVAGAAVLLAGRVAAAGQPRRSGRGTPEPPACSGCLMSPCGCCTVSQRPPGMPGPRPASRRSDDGSCREEAHGRPGVRFGR